MSGYDDVMVMIKMNGWLRLASPSRVKNGAGMIILSMQMMHQLGYGWIGVCIESSSLLCTY